MHAISASVRFLSQPSHQSRTALLVSSPASDRVFRIAARRRRRTKSPASPNMYSKERQGCVLS